MKKFLITIKDLTYILNKQDTEILAYIDEGLPHYYYHGVLYFEYHEVQDWFIKRIDLGVSRLSVHTIVHYLKQCIDKEITPTNLFSKIKRYREEHGEGSNPIIEKLYRDMMNKDTQRVYGMLKYIFPEMTLSDSLRYYLMVFKDQLEKGLI